MGGQLRTAPHLSTTKKFDSGLVKLCSLRKYILESAFISCFVVHCIYKLTAENRIMTFDKLRQRAGFKKWCKWEIKICYTTTGGPIVT